MTTARPASQTVRTSLCPVTLEARLQGRATPAILCVRGAWAPADYMAELFDLFPDTDIVLGDLPGMRDVAPTRSDAASFVQAYDEVIAQLLPGRAVVGFGASTGALVALGLRAPEVRVKVAMEPFLSTGALWPLILTVRHFIRESGGKPALVQYASELFGYTLDGVEDRRFDALLDGVDQPLHAIVGSVPLGAPRPLDDWPSLVDERTRRRLADHPCTTLHEAPPGVGHHVTRGEAGWALLEAVLREALEEATR